MMAAIAKPANMTLAELLEKEALRPLDGIEWSGLESDSRQLQAGQVFVALPGERVDGRRFIDDAIARGASAVLVPAGAGAAAIEWREGVPVVAVKKLAARVSELAGRAYADPSAELDIVGITGTNGKTTCSVLIAQLLARLGAVAGTVGTLGYGLSGQSMTPTGLTTPDAIAAQSVLAQLREAGAESVAMEVSSHALAQGRVRAVQIRTAVFTNLSHDHLDYHGDLKAYGKAKAKLLKARGLQNAVINRDDDWAAALADKASMPADYLSYSLGDERADVRASDLSYTAEGVRGQLHTPAGTAAFRAPLVGDFNVSNLLAAVSVALLRGYPLEKIVAALAELTPAPGRMEPVATHPAQDIQVVVDYAHTPDALEKALRSLRRHCDGDIWCVFGCGGDRDRDKRAVMGRVAEKSADCPIVTNDNPRSEDPARIASDIVSGMHHPDRCLVIAERDKAIDLAIAQAAPGDTVLIAGKGHETYQQFADRQLPFSDRQQARLALGRRLARQTGAGGEA